MCYLSFSKLNSIESIEFIENYFQLFGILKQVCVPPACCLYLPGCTVQVGVCCRGWVSAAGGCLLPGGGVCCQGVSAKAVSIPDMYSIEQVATQISVLLQKIICQLALNLFALADKAGGSTKTVASFSFTPVI